MAQAREIVRDAFHMKKPERPPVGVCLGGSWPFFAEKVSLRELLDSPPARAAEIFYRVNASIGADFVTVGTGATALLIEALGGEIRFTPSGAPEITSLLINTGGDINKLDIDAALKSERLAWLKEVAVETARLNTDAKSLFVSGRAPFTLAGQLAGLEKLSKSLYKDKAFAEKLLAFTEELSVAYFEFMLEVNGLDGIFIADPSASGDVVSVKHFEEFILPRLTGLVNRLKPHGKLSLIHICGNITDRLRLLPQTGIQMVSVDSKVDLKTAKEILDGKIGLAGNVDPVSVIEERTAEQVFADSVRCLNAAAKDGGFMLLPGCDLSAKASAENVRAFARAVYEWRE